MNTLIVKQNNELLVSQEVLNEIVKITDLKKDLDSKLDELKLAIKNAMEENDVKSFKSDLVDISYVEATEKIIVDNDKFKNEFEEVYLQCLKKSQVKSSIRIKVK